MRKLQSKFERQPLNKLLNIILKKGKKEYTNNNATILLFKLQKQINCSYSKIIWIVFKALHTTLECRAVKRRGRITNIPFKIHYFRQFYLSCKWLFKSTLINTNKIKTIKKIILEFDKIIKKESNETQKLRAKNSNLVFSNRGNSHYRW
jgi:ribosomal protein S7